MWNIFKKRSKDSIFEFLETDIHSHLLPGVDDGVTNIESALSFISELKQLGYNKLIITPHIHSELYPNNKYDLTQKFQVLKNTIEQIDNSVQVELAAEYYIDNKFKELIQNRELLTFGDSFILVETSFVGLSMNFESILFELITLGYRPVLAHPERYNYLSRSLKYFRYLNEMGVYLQVNLLSLMGYYGRESYRIAEFLLKEKIVSFIGTDLHNEKHLKLLQKVEFSDSYFKLLKSQPILNNQV